MSFEEWYEKHVQVLLGGRLLASNEKLKETGKSLYDDAQPKWQPINTLPEDILKYELDILVIERKGLPCMASYCNSEREWFASTTAALLNPTHWTPIPNLPNKENCNEN